MRPLRDLLQSISLGPLRLAVPIVGYLGLYALIAREHGTEVLGAWVLLSSFSALVSVIDTGLVPYMTRRAIELGGSDNKLDTEAKSLTALFLLITFALLLGHIAYAGVRIALGGWREEQMVGASALMTLGTGVLAISRLRTASVIADSKNAYVLLSTAISQCAFFLVAGVASEINLPLYGLGVASVTQGLAMCMLLNFAGSGGRTQTTAGIVDLAIAVRVLWHSRHFMASSAALAARQPLARIALASAGNLDVVAVFDAALRGALAIREVITAGFTALLPFLVRLRVLDDTALTATVCKVGMVVIVAASASAYSLAAYWLSTIVEIWLGTHPAGFTSAATVMFVWGFVTAINVVFWYVLLAYALERYAAKAAALHCLVLLGMVVLAASAPLGAVGASLYWLVSSLGTQAYIYYHVHRRTGLLVPSFANWRVLSVCALGLAIMALGFIYGHEPQSGVSLLYVAAAIVGYLSYSWFVIARSVSRLFLQLAGDATAVQIARP